jgi:hypothetical protein
VLDEDCSPRAVSHEPSERTMRKPGRRSKSATRKKPDDAPDIERIFAEGVEVDRAFDRAVREALRQHKRAGNPIPVWKNGKVVWIPASKIRP